MKPLKIIIVAIFVMIPTLLFAADTPQLPRYLNFQSLLFNDNGSPVTETFIDLEFYISGQDGTDLYSERQQQVQVINGAEEKTSLVAGRS